MLCQDIIDILERQSPREYALEWDNVGLLVGSRDKQVRKLLIAVDATLEVCNEAIEGGYDMIVTHHPMIFSKLKQVNGDTVLGRKIISLIQHGICCYAMHTNFDTIGGMGKEAAQILGLKNIEVLEETHNGEGIGCVGMLDTTSDIGSLGEKVKNSFGLKNVILFGDKGDKVDKVAICPGSGKSVIGEAVAKGATCLITGDIGHHDGIDAVEMGLNIIDASHYGIEKIFVEIMHKYIKGQCPDIEVSKAQAKEPFEII